MSLTPDRRPIVAKRARSGPFRRLIAGVVFVALLAVDLGLVAYLSRNVWLEPILRTELQSVLTDALGGEVRLDRIEGDWIRDLRVSADLSEATDPNAVLRSVDGLRVATAFDLVALARGDLSGLTTLRAHALRVELRLPPDSETESESDAGTFDPDSIRPYLDALPNGAEITVDRLVVSTADGRPLHDGPVRLLVESARSVRVLLTHAHGDVELRIHRGPDLLTRMGARLEDPGSLLRALGVENDLSGGTLQLLARIEPTAPRAEALLSWSGGEVEGQGAARLDADVVATSSSVRGSVDVDVPGLRAEGHALHLPLTGDALAGLRGAVTVDVHGRGTWERWLPDEARGYLPVTGRVHAELGPGTVRIGRGQLVGADWAISISGGEFPLSGEGGHVAVTAVIGEERRIALDAETELRLSGRLSGQVQGSLAAPRFRGRAELGAGGIADWSWDRVRADVRFEDDAISLGDLDVGGVRRESSPSDSGVQWVGDVTVEFPQYSPSRPLLVDADGRLTATTLSGISDDPALRTIAPGAVRIDARVELPSGELPRGEALVSFSELRCSAERAPSAARIDVRSTPADGGRLNLEVAVDGTFDPRLLQSIGVDEGLFAHVSSAAVTATVRASMASAGGSLPDASLELELAELAIGNAPPASTSIRANLTGEDRILTIERASIEGPGRIDVSGILPLADGAADLSARVAIDDLSPFAELLPWLPRAGRLTTTADLRGPLDDPSLAGLLEVHVPDLGSAGFDWPESLGTAPAGPVSAAVDLTFARGALDISTAYLEVRDATESAARVDISGSPPLAFRDGQLAHRDGDALLHASVRIRQKFAQVGETSLGTELLWDSRSLRAEELTVTTSHGAAEGDVAVDGFSDALLAGEPGSAPITGQLDFDSFDLSTFPMDWAREVALAGHVTGTVAVGGTVARPVPTGEIDFRNCSMKLAATMPTFSEIEGKLRLTESAAEIESVRGRLGLGEVDLTGRVQSPEGGLLDQLDAATLRLDLRTDDVLLLRSTGLKLRADSNIVVEGTLDDLKVHGDVEIGYGKVIRRISLVPEFGRRGGSGVDGGITLFHIPPPLGRAVHFDVAVRTTQPIDVVTHVVNAPIDVALRLRGTGVNPRLEGAVSASSGTLRMPAITFGIQQALLTFRPDSPRFPEIRLVARARRQSIDLTATATGRIDSVEVLLSSVPPLKQSELVVLTSTGQLPDRLAEQGLAGQATMVGGYLATEIFDYYFGSDSTETGESFIDRFHFYSGREIGRTGNESMTVDFDITDRFGLQTERDVYADYNMGLVYRIRF